MAQNRRARFITGPCMFYATECRATHKVLNHRPALPCLARPTSPQIVIVLCMYLYALCSAWQVCISERNVTDCETRKGDSTANYRTPDDDSRGKTGLESRNFPNGSRNGLATPRYVYSSCIIEALSCKIDSVFDMISAPSSFK